MNPKNLILFIIFITTFIFYYQITDDNSTQTAKVIQVLDGDTLVLNDSTKIRLLGINTPESNQPFYQEAKDFLTVQTLNQTIQLESKGQDKYGRTLAHIFKDNQHINELILLQGLATLYYYDQDQYYQPLQEAEIFAREQSLGIWNPSPNQPCIKIIQFQTTEPESLILQNTCDHQINLTYKDDATHIYQTTINANSIYQNNFSHIWNDDGDTLYAYDTKGLLIFQRYK